MTDDSFADTLIDIFEYVYILRCLFRCIKMCCTVYRKGDEIQKLSVIESLPHLLTIDSNAALSKVLPKIQQELTKSSSEFHVATSKVFQVIFAGNYKVNGNLTPIVLQGIESKDPVVSNAWVETLLDIIRYLSIRTVQAEVRVSITA